jgi:hypothetical protein
MAHVGKKYKLWFRRDLSINRKNVDGWAECYVCRASGFAGTDSSIWNQSFWQCVNLTKGAVPDREWVSEYRIINGVEYRLRWSITNNINLGSDSVRVYMERKTLGTILSFDARDVSTPYEYQIRNWGFKIAETAPVTPARLRLAGGGMAAAAAEWAIYNP